MLVGTSRGLRQLQAIHFSPLDERNTPDPDLLILLIALPGLAGGSPSFRQFTHRNSPAQLVPDEIDDIPRAHAAGWFGAYSIKPYVAACDRFGGEATRLEEAGKVEPLVDSQGHWFGLEATLVFASY